jgi:hypothetical protein
MRPTPAIAWIVRVVAAGGALAGALWACGARASESGASLYLLGSGGPQGGGHAARARRVPRQHRLLLPGLGRLAG